MEQKSPRNQTLSCSTNELQELARDLLCVGNDVSIDEITNSVACGDTFDIAPKLPERFVDLLFLDPPYNLSKNFNGNLFREKERADYVDWFQTMLGLLKPTLKPNATIYVCSDWRTSTLIAPVLEKMFKVNNRITWERDKGRGAKTNWKNNTEDIWYCTMGTDYTFNVDAVKMKRKVIAPYRVNGKPKDWNEEKDGNYRLTHPSNIWTDLTIPFWSMPENTDHPTQKPEKLVAKLLLASTNENDFVFDPFLGSGTTAVVAKKLKRKYFGIEMDREYCCWAKKRLNNIDKDPAIQGYKDGVFWDRNSLSKQRVSS